MSTDRRRPPHVKPLAYPGRWPDVDVPEDEDPDHYTAWLLGRIVSVLTAARGSEAYDSIARKVSLTSDTVADALEGRTWPAWYVLGRLAAELGVVVDARLADEPERVPPDELADRIRMLSDEQHRVVETVVSALLEQQQRDGDGRR